MERDDPDIHRLLAEIRDDQRAMLAQQQQALELTREQLEITRRHFERAEKLQDRAEKLQTRGEGLIGGAKKVFIVIVPILIALLLYVSWLLFGVVL